MNKSAVVLWFREDKRFGKAVQEDGRQVFLPPHTECTFVVENGKIVSRKDPGITIKAPVTGNHIVVVDAYEDERGLNATAWGYESSHEAAKKVLDAGKTVPAPEPKSTVDPAPALAEESTPKRDPATKATKAKKPASGSKAKK